MHLAIGALLYAGALRGFMRKIHAALFDVDGTLLNTAEFVNQAFVHTFQTHGLPRKSFDEVAALMGKPLEEMYRRISASEDVSELCETHRSFQIENLHLSVPFANTQETLRRLKDAGIKIAAVTTRSRRTSIRTLEIGGILEYFDAVLSGEDVGNPKPHPEPLMKALQQLRVQPEKAAMIGDTEADILAGRKATVMTIGVSYGFQGPRIAGSKPDFIVEDIADVISILLAEDIPING
jgi:pyrophosphatase PpaX